MTRRRYLDWLRGVAVLIMIEAHVLDAWTHPDDRDAGYRWAIAVGGFGAPLFLFLAGVALALACGSRVRSGQSEAEAARRARRRGWQVFGLACLFRLQSWVISGGGLRSILKVDILNIMGLSMLVAALLWGAGRRHAWRAILFAAATGAVAMLAPVVHAMPALAALPDPVEAYLRRLPGGSSFSLFPWAAFLLAGGLVGLWLDAVGPGARERRVNLVLAVLGPAIAAAAYAASLLPPIFDQTSFWITSPAFFFLRLGVLLALLPLAYAWNTRQGGSWLCDFGVSSLFVYWIHVEMVYGVVSLPLHRTLPLWAAGFGVVAMTLLLFGLVRAKDRMISRRPGQLTPSHAAG